MKMKLIIALIVGLGVTGGIIYQTQSANPNEITLSTPVVRTTVATGEIINVEPEIVVKIPSLEVKIKEIRVKIKIGDDIQAVTLKENDLTGINLNNLAGTLMPKITSLIQPNGKLKYTVTPKN